MRAPLAPMGWPMATAPPLTLTRSRERPSSLVTPKRLDAEGLVEFEEIDVIEGPAGAGEDFLDACDRCEHDPPGSDATGGLRADGGEWLEVQIAGALRGT